MRLASDTPSLRSMSVPSDLQRGREALLLVVALIRWAAMFRPVTMHQPVFSGYCNGFPLSTGQVECQQPPMISERHIKYKIKNTEGEALFLK